MAKEASIPEKKVTLEDVLEATQELTKVVTTLVEEMGKFRGEFEKFRKAGKF